MASDTDCIANEEKWTTRTRKEQELERTGSTGRENMSLSSMSTTDIAKASPRGPRVLVVGAGFAGVSAAAALREGGVNDVVVLEAQQQPGGRLQKMELEDGFVELGAQFIHGETGNYLYELAEKFGLLMDTYLYKSEKKTSDCTADDYTGCVFYNSRGEKVHQDSAVQLIRLINGIFRKYTSASFTDALNKSDHFAATFSNEDAHILAATNYGNATGLKTNLPIHLEVSNAVEQFGCKKGVSTFAELLEKVREEIVADHEDSELATAVFNWMVQYEYADKGARPAELSLGGYGKLLNTPGYGLTASASGLLDIFRTLVARSLPPDCIRVCKVVKAIHWTADRTLNGLCENGDSSDTGSGKGNEDPPLTIICEDGEIFSADHVIVTTSVAYLQKNELSLFRPPLPEKYRHALHRMSFGIVDKIFLIWDDLDAVLDPKEDGIQFLWLDNDFSRPPSDKTARKTQSGKNWYDMLQGFERTPSHKGALLTWLAGEETVIMEALPEQEVRDVLYELLVQFTNNKRLPRPKQIIRSQWQSNPYILGSYSYIPADMDLESHNLLSIPLPSHEVNQNARSGQNPVLQISGEATSHRYFSTAHGAIDSGRKAASCILRHYNTN